MEFSVTGRTATSHAGALSSTPPPSRRRKMTLRSLASASGSPTSFLSFIRTAEPLFSQSLPRKRRRKQMQNANLALDGLEHLRSTANIRTSIRLQVDRYMGDEAEGRHDQPLSRRRWQFSPRREATPNRTKGLSGCMICKALSELRARLDIRALLFRHVNTRYIVDCCQ